jgi:hypothetical protein
MAATSVQGGAVQLAARARSRTLTPAEAAWIAAGPCALLLIGAVLALSKPLGAVLFAPPPNDFWPSMRGQVLPEPTEHASYLFAIGAPLLLSGVIVASLVRPLRLADLPRRVLVHGSQAALCAFAVVCLVAQHRIWFGALYTYERPTQRAYFTWPTVAVAVVLAALTCAVIASEPLRARALALLRETRARRIAAAAAAALFTAVWLLTAINVDSSVGNVNQAVYDMLPWSMDETFAILNGRTPLVSFHPAYAQLWPYLTAATMSLIGTSLGVYTTLMATIGGASLLAIFAVLRRVARSSLAALGLFMPFLATSFFLERGPLSNRYGPGNLLTIFPVRYAGPYFLAWLLTRHLDGRAPRRAWPLFLAAGLVAINNVEFGAPAFAAALCACAWAQPPRTRATALRLARDVAAGLLGAIALVVLVTLVRSGSLPRFGLLLEFAKLYGLTGWAMVPMPTLGFHLVVYVTLAAAIVVATVRAARREQDATLTGLLVFSGVFGLGAGAYYAGRSHPEVLIDLFSAWMLALVLLVVIVVRTIAARTPRRPTLVELAVLAAFGLGVCSIAQTPTPWGQIRRLGDATKTPAFVHNAMEQFIARETRRGESVVILNPLGHRIAYDLGLVNVSPYSSVEAVNTPPQLEATLDALRAAHGSRVFVWVPDSPQEIVTAIEALGFANVRADQGSGTLEFVATGEQAGH